MDFVYDNNVSLIKENIEAYICTKERQSNDICDIDNNNNITKPQCFIKVNDRLDMAINKKTEKDIEKEKKKAEKKAEKDIEREKKKAEKDIEREKKKAEKDIEREKKKAEKDKMKDEKKAEKDKMKDEKKAEKDKRKDEKNVGKKNRNNDLYKGLKKNEKDMKIKGRPRIEYNVKIVTEINDDEPQEYNFLEVEEYCIEVTRDKITYYQDRNGILYDYETHEEI